ncbi:hypothetical protein LUZ60_017747 [Juncus effusus]|nr:hypothetical protein LUZ60_017747 [Juncus effusus]
MDVSSPLSSSSSKEAVYVAAVPLRAARGPPQMAMSIAYNLGQWDLQHFLVLIKPSNPSLSEILVFDFQPKDPEDIFAAVAVLSQRKLPGVILERKISRLPRTRCSFVGFSNGNSAEIANKFNENWSTDLIVGKNDCRHYTNGLVHCLTGKEDILESLKATFSK